MSIEARTSLLITERPAIDADFQTIMAEVPATVPLYEGLQLDASTLDEKRQRFERSDRQESPDLRPLTVDSARLDSRETSLREAKKQIVTSDKPSELRNAYRWMINEEIAQARALRGSHAGDKEVFDAYNRFAYGSVNHAVADAVTAWFRTEATQALAHERSAVRDAAHEVLELIPDRGGNAALLIPDTETFVRIKEQQYRRDGYFALLLAGVGMPENGPVKPEVGDPILRQALLNMNAGEYELRPTQGSAWSADNANKRVNRPETYSMPLLRFMGLPAGHEFSHVLEYQNGKRQPIRQLASGLDRYESGNEGRAIIREQVPYESFEAFSKLLRWQDILRRHFAVSLGTGVWGQEQTFADMYPVLNVLDRLWEREHAKEAEDVGAADEKAHRRTWSLLATNALRGTLGSGGAFMRAKLYLEGNVACWSTLRDQPDLMDQGDYGKFDITNPRHVVLLQKFNILPTEQDAA